MELFHFPKKAGIPRAYVHDLTPLNPVLEVAEATFLNNAYYGPKNE
jgi:hypothetical protein